MPDQKVIDLKIEWRDHTEVVLTNSRGDTFTSKSEELADFLHSAESSFPVKDKGVGMNGADLTIIRNKLVDILPTGDVTAWDLINSIKQYIQWFDNYTAALVESPSPSDQIGEFESVKELKLKHWNAISDTYDRGNYDAEKAAESCTKITLEYASQPSPDARD